MGKISIILPNLEGGGAERMSLYLSKQWLQHGYDVEIVVMQKTGSLLKLIGDPISVYSLDTGNIRSSIILLSKYFKKRKPDVICARMWPLTSAAILAWLLAGKPGKVFISDHNQLSISCVEELHLPRWYLKLLIASTYPFSSGIICVSNGVKNDLCSLGGLSEQSVKVIYNPAAIGVPAVRLSEEIRKKLWGPGYDYHVLAVGTLKAQKDHATLIKAFSKLPLSLNAKLTILGDGPLRLELEALIHDRGLRDRVSLPGFAVDAYPWYRTCDLFVLSSRWEGFANVIVEALESGLPVVSTDCPSGPAEILENGRYGRLVPVGDVDALAKAMVASLADTHDRDALIRRARDFSVEKIADEYLDYFRSSGAEI